MLVSLYCRKQHNIIRCKPPVQLPSKSSREAILATDCKALANDADAVVSGNCVEPTQSVQKPEIPSHQQLVSGVNIRQVASEVETGTCVVDVEIHAVAQSASEPENLNALLSLINTGQFTSAPEPGISSICAKVNRKPGKNFGNDKVPQQCKSRKRQLNTMQQLSARPKKGPPAKGLILLRKQKNAKFKQTADVLEATEGDSNSTTSYVPSSSSHETDTESEAENLVASVATTDSAENGSQNTRNLMLG